MWLSQRLTRRQRSSPMVWISRMGRTKIPMALAVSNSVTRLEGAVHGCKRHLI